MEEIWKEIKGYEKRYKVSNYGRVRATFPKGNTYSRMLSLVINAGGYKYVSIGNKHRLVHRLVCEAFLPNPENKAWVNHKDGNKQNNHIDNLEWSTPKENINHALDTGLTQTGEKRFRAKLTNDQVREIRELYKSGVKQVEISKKLGVTQSIIWACTHNYCYKRVI